VAAEDVAAPWDMPLYDNSAMDGFAVRSEDCRAGASLRVTGYIPAGETATPAVLPGCAVRIMTGAQIPPGCDAVVPIEETEERESAVLLRGKVNRSQHIRFRGEDVRSGDTVVTAGTVLHPPDISMLASFGKAFVPVHRKARVAVLSTGDELVELGETLSPGKIINSNALSLAAAVTATGAEPVILGIARDNMKSHRERMTEGLKADVLITSAGVSGGDRDLVRDCLTELGVHQLFWRVDIKPGGPLAFGVKEGKPVFSLPGNPVSTMVTFEEFVRPALLRMMGHRRVIPPYVKATLRGEVRKKPGKVHFLRVRIEVENGVRWAIPAGDQHTGILRTMVRANGIAVLPKEKAVFADGEEVAVHLLRGDAEMLED
ncbi:MAG: molybdopterin molybdotransferase MoeA, partial [Deltaproteobacteria bacterium]|nr:molybdopterin molybdotransferase MoeA [Deltaproteobacteria bacterium]